MEPKTAAPLWHCVAPAFAADAGWCRCVGTAGATADDLLTVLML